MDTIVLKFGGSSLADNEKLKIVANKIINRAKENKVVVIVSAQGKTTDNLINQSKELAEMVETTDSQINKRELDMLLSSGEQMSSAKLSILLNLMGYKSISLNAWQVGIYTNSNYQNALIEKIDKKRTL